MAIRQSKNMSAGPSIVPYADMSLDGPEIGTLVAVVDRARNLPNRKTMGKQDPYCAMRLGKEAKKTETDRRGGQTPRWDQELRFTVHDSPDYYKLKCSVFNDDKKADLIGEVWIDLKDLVVSGGGQNDLWHQLNFKGKYAGDIRMELTYYDTRVNPELEAGKIRQKERGFAGDNTSNASTSRHLGPREVKRRPLPTGPTHSAPAKLPQPVPIQRQLPLQPGASYPMQHLMQQQPPSVNMDPYAPPPHQHWTPPKPSTHYTIGQDALLHDPYAREQRQIQPQDHADHYTAQNRYESDDHLENLHSSASDPRPVILHSYSELQPMAYDISSPVSSPYAPVSFPYSADNSSPPVRQSPPSLPEIPPRTHRLSTSPVKYAAYRDSPLRQSISQNEVHSPNTPYDDLDGELDGPPPPPPSHRNSLPRLPSSTHNTPPQEQFRRLPAPPVTLGDRSPLQLIEHRYTPHLQQEQVTPERRKPRNSCSSQAYSNRQPAVADSPEDAFIGDFPAPHQLTQSFGIDFADEPIEQDCQGRYNRRNSGLDDSLYRLPQRAQTFDSADMFDERNTYRSEPQLVRPRAVSPSAGQAVPRLSVSPHPQPLNNRNRLSGVPFGPDSYDMLNPPSEPVSDSFSTPVHSQEEARQQELEMMTQQGPIIGNDGRVIDPSDHLPSDTWAPEPERKVRKPEHVIRIRTRDDARNSRAGSSPLPIKSTSINSSPHQPPVISQSPYQLTPDPTPPPSSGQRRNRLQKQIPNRPLPSQPFAHPHSSPASIPQVHDFPHHRTPPKNSIPSSPTSGQQRHSIYNMPPSGPPSRPPLSDYQVPTGDTDYNYSPRGSYGPPAQRNSFNTPAKLLTQRPQSYAAQPSMHDDPLAAELSMIDIGPSRGGGRTALRSNRGYGGGGY